METPRRVALAVEDDTVSRQILVRALERLHFEVLAAEDGAQGLALFERASPAVVVTDWMMPGCSGLDLCRSIRERAPRKYVYVLVLTARAEKKDFMEALAAGADEFLTKPLDSAELGARLATAERVLGLEASLAERLRQLEEAQARLIEAERLAAIGAVGITVRHEVNNPLTGILGEVDLRLLERTGLPPHVVKSFETIGKLTRRIASAVARIQAATTTRLKEYLPGGPMMIDIDPEGTGAAEESPGGAR